MKRIQPRPTHMMLLAAKSMSASSHTTTGAFPPSSSVIGFRLAAQTCEIIRPTRVDPGKRTQHASGTLTSSRGLTGKVDLADGFCLNERIGHRRGILARDVHHVQHTGGETGIEEELCDAEVRLWRVLAGLENDDVAARQGVDDCTHRER